MMGDDLMTKNNRENLKILAIFHDYVAEKRELKIPNIGLLINGSLYIAKPLKLFWKKYLENRYWLMLQCGTSSIF